MTNDRWPKEFIAYHQRAAQQGPPKQGQSSKVAVLRRLAMVHVASHVRNVSLNEKYARQKHAQHVCWVHEVSERPWLVAPFPRANNDLLGLKGIGFHHSPWCWLCKWKTSKWALCSSTYKLGWGAPLQLASHGDSYDDIPCNMTMVVFDELTSKVVDYIPLTVSTHLYMYIILMEFHVIDSLSIQCHCRTNLASQAENIPLQLPQSTLLPFAARGKGDNRKLRAIKEVWCHYPW